MCPLRKVGAALSPSKTSGKSPHQCRTNYNSDVQRRPHVPAVRCPRWPQHPGLDATPAPPYPTVLASAAGGQARNWGLQAPIRNNITCRPTGEQKGRQKPTGGQRHDARGCTSLTSKRARGEAAAGSVQQQHTGMEQHGLGTRCA